MSASRVIGQVSEFNPELENWEDYNERLCSFFSVNGIKEDLEKVNLLITVMGATAYSLLKRLLIPVKPKERKYDELVKCLQEYFVPQKSVITERFKFYKRDQQENESVSDYIIEIRRLANSCKFDSFEDDAMRDRLVCGVKREAIQKILLNTGELTFLKACTLAKNHEVADCNSRMLQSESKVGERSEVSQVSKYRQSIKREMSVQSRDCFRCGRRHDEKECPAKEWECFTCHKTGHTSRMCRQRHSGASQRQSHSETNRRQSHPASRKDRRVKTVDESDDDIESDKTSGDESVQSCDINIRSLKSVSVKHICKPVVVSMTVEGTSLKMEVDSGAVCSIVSEDTYRSKFPELSCYKSSKKLRTVSGEKLRVVGEIKVAVTKNCKDYYLPLVVVKSKGVTPLLGRTWLDVLIPEWRKSMDVSSGNLVKVLRNSKLGLSPAEEFDIKIVSVDSTTHINASEVANETRKDVILSRVLEFTQCGWPAHVWDESLKPYYKRRNELSVDARCLTSGNRLVIPLRLREAVLELLHEQHPGVVCTKRLSRSYVWWPGLDQDIEEKVGNCIVCQQTLSAAPHMPWERIHSDFVKKNGQLKPSLRGKLMGKKRYKQEEIGSSRVPKSRLFQVGQTVWMKTRRREETGWQIGEVKKRLGQDTYLVDTAGRIRMMHADHLREHRVQGGHSEEITDLRTIDPSTQDKEVSSTPISLPPRRSPETELRTPPRRSQRTVQAPKRLNL